MDNTYITVDEAAVELGIARATIWKWIKLHELQRYRVMGDRRAYIRRADLEVLKEPMPIKKAAA